MRTVRGESHPLYRQINRTCGVCGCEYTVSPYRSETTRYCSYACAGLAGRNTIDDFWSKVQKGDPGECWYWQGYVSPDGYGHFFWMGKDEPAHRLAFEFTFYELPGNIFACHKCDHRACCNPFHIFPGTLQENLADMVAKGRQTRGELQAATSLTADDVRCIRLMAETTKHVEIARSYGVSPQTIHRIVHRKVWQHID